MRKRLPRHLVEGRTLYFLLHRAASADRICHLDRRHRDHLLGGDSDLGSLNYPSSLEMAIKPGLWYRWCFNAVGQSSRYGVVLGVYIGSLIAAGFWMLCVSFLQRRRSKNSGRRQSSAMNGPSVVFWITRNKRYF